MNSVEFPEMNYKHFREKNAKFHIILLLSIMGGISLITIYDRKFRHNRPEEGLPKMITYISPINMVAEDNHLYFAYKSPLGRKFLWRSGRKLLFSGFLKIDANQLVLWEKDVPFKISSKEAVLCERHRPAAYVTTHHKEEGKREA